MPNWCENRVTISGPNSVIEDIKTVLASENAGLLAHMVPEPKYEDDQAWYNWRIDNWGTKWEICDPYIQDYSDTTVTVTFQTAWGPPTEAFRTWAEQQQDVEFELDYFEPGCAFVGKAVYESGGVFYDDFVSSDVQPDTYRSLAENEWDWIFDDEEPEPLTEWYLNGVKELGLDK